MSATVRNEALDASLLPNWPLLASLLNEIARENGNVVGRLRRTLAAQVRITVKALLIAESIDPEEELVSWREASCEGVLDSIAVLVRYLLLCKQSGEQEFVFLNRAMDGQGKLNGEGRGSRIRGLEEENEQLRLENEALQAQVRSLLRQGRCWKRHK